MKLSGLVIIVLITLGFFCSRGNGMQDQEKNQMIELVPPRSESSVSLEAALQKRRSIRSFKDKPVSLAAVSQLLWAAQGITGPNGFRTAPSAGALYPLEIYVVGGKITDLAAGIYRYRPRQHALVKVKAGDHRRTLYREALSQSAVSEAPLSLVITGIPERTTSKYGNRGIRYVFMEAGHAAQNICLQAVALELGSVVIGAFSDQAVGELLQVGRDTIPLYIIPVGKE